MKYALLIHTDPASLDGMTESEYAAMHAEYMAIRDDPACLGGAQLQPPAVTTTVRVAGGDTLVTDGPFADTKEVFAGYYVIDVDDIDAATAIAARIPAAHLGGAIEIRPVVETPAAPSTASASDAAAR